MRQGRRQERSREMAWDREERSTGEAYRRQPDDAVTFDDPATWDHADTPRTESEGSAGRS